MILQSFIESATYVASDAYFLPSMAATAIIGLFVGAVVYDGCVQDLKKMLISLFSYATLIMMVTAERVIPSFYDGVFRTHHPFSGIATILSVTLFYLLGMVVGVWITNKAHPQHY